MPIVDQGLPAALAEALRQQVDTAELRYVAAENAVLGPFSAELGVGRTVPRGIMVPFRGGPSVPARYALDVAGMVVADRDSGDILIAGQDYVVDETYGSLCLPESGSGSGRSVVLSYTYSLARIDRLERSPTGDLDVARGIGHLTAPRPPRQREAWEHLALVYVPHFAGEGDYEVFTEAEHRRPLPASSGRLPGMQARIDAGEEIRLLFLGDSITEGGDASTDRDSFPVVAAECLSRSIPGIDLDLNVVARGGSRSAQWLDDSAFPECDWSRIDDARPHLTVIEFLNDVYLDAEDLPANYDELIRRLRAIGSEVVLTTPPFTTPATMSDTGYDGVDRRAYVLWLRDYAEAEGIPLVDVSAMWEQLADDGMPYWTLLANGLNHPDDRGHQMAGELIAGGIQEMLGRGDNRKEDA